jgi:hypothetical protein
MKVGTKKTNRNKIYPTSFKIPQTMKNFIDYLVDNNYMHSISEFTRFCLRIYLHDNPNPNIHLNKFFSETFYHNPTTKKVSITIKILPELRGKMTRIARQHKVTRSLVLRQAIDYAGDYFTDDYFSDNGIDLSNITEVVSDDKILQP